MPARAFLDANHDGIFDTGDTPIALDQVFVDLNHNGEDDDGLNYLSLDDGTFTVRLPPGNYALVAHDTSVDGIAVKASPVSISLPSKSSVAIPLVRA